MDNFFKTEGMATGNNQNDMFGKLKILAKNAIKQGRFAEFDEYNMYRFGEDKFVAYFKNEQRVNLLKLADVYVAATDNMNGIVDREMYDFHVWAPFHVDGLFAHYYFKIVEANQEPWDITDEESDELFTAVFADAPEEVDEIVVCENDCSKCFYKSKCGKESVDETESQNKECGYVPDEKDYHVVWKVRRNGNVFYPEGKNAVFDSYEDAVSNLRIARSLMPAWLGKRLESASSIILNDDFTMVCFPNGDYFFAAVCNSEEAEEYFSKETK